MLRVHKQLAAGVKSSRILFSDNDKVDDVNDDDDGKHESMFFFL